MLFRSWRNSPRTQDATSDNFFWTVRYYGQEASAGSSTITVAYTNVVQQTSFTGVVVFSGGTLTDGSTSKTPLEASDVGSSGSTTIDGGRITTGSITSQNHSGTGDGSAFSSAGTKINLNNGSISSPNFRIASNGSAAFSGTLSIGGTTLTSTNTLNSNTTKSDVGLGNVDNNSTATIRAGTTKANVGLGNVDNTSDATVLSNAADNANTADKTDGTVGGWNID